MITQPITDRLRACRSVLLAGAGGGYDVFGALPIALELIKTQTRVHFANVSFTRLDELRGAIRVDEHECLYKVLGKAAREDVYCPEAWMARWLQEHFGQTPHVWAFRKTGVLPLRNAFRYLTDTLKIDGIVLVDGGVDTILRGDESSIGTPAEDLATLAALRRIRVATKVIACVGLGTQLREGICHAQVLERIAELTKMGAFCGAAALVGDSQPGRLYRDLIYYVAQHQAKRSRIHMKIERALRGEFGTHGEHEWLSPLMPLYWFFDLAPVAESHLFLRDLDPTERFAELPPIIEGCRKGLEIRERNSIPI